MANVVQRTISDAEIGTIIGLLDDAPLGHGLQVVDVPLADQERLRKLADPGLPLRHSPGHGAPAIRLPPAAMVAGN